MHELSIAMQLMEQVETIAKANNLRRVDEVELETGTLRQVIPEMMQTAFKEASHETVAQGAILTIRDIPAKAQCNQCSFKFEPEPDNFICPTCQVADVTILDGDKIILKSVSCN